MRWDEQSARDDRERQLPGLNDGITVRTFDAPEAAGINFHEVNARSALNRVPGSRLPFNWTVNPYRGCSHACSYCFARRTHTYLDFDAGRDFEKEIVVKVNVPELLRAELGRPTWKRELVALGTNTDPYQWVESRYRLMPGILRALRDYRTPVSVLSKSPLVLRDLSLYKEVAEVAEASVNLSVPTIDEKAWRESEPHTPHPNARLETVAKLNREGIPSGVMVAPLMPGINDDPEQVAEIVRLAEEAGATFIGAVALHLRNEVKDVFMGWLRLKRPDLLPRYEELYDGRAYAPSDERKRLSALVSRARRSSTPVTRTRSARSRPGSRAAPAGRSRTR